MPLTFNPETMGTGADSVDVQHRQLVEIINHLLLAMVSGHATDEVGPILEDLAAYAGTHFDHEEACMARFGCPVAQANRDAHAAFTRTFTALRADFDRDGPSATLAIRMQHHLADWVLNHIVRIDAALRPCVPPGTTA